ncbi:MAG: UDP-N-acetylmuramoyl-L-alanyl-D-glutamate--2,6-diaminopimelate ligase [Verrucomicrobiota bacterium]
MRLPDLQISTLIENRFWSPSVVPYAGGGGSSLPEVRLLSELVGGFPLVAQKGSMEQEVQSIITDSRRVVPKSLFFARKGLRTDGRLFVEEAIDRGAVGIVSEDPPGSHAGVTFLQVASVPEALASMSGEFYGWPDRKLQTVGVTGTNGKTTVSWLARELMAADGAKCGLIGTIHYDLGGRTVPSYKTTPESVDTFSLMSQMIGADCKSMVMEVSSHGIDQKRVQGIDFDIAVFLNLTQDHLDYHYSMEEYYQVKKRLFDGGIGTKPKLSIINQDDEYGQRLLREVGESSSVRTFGLGPQADYRAEAIRFSRSGVSFRLITPSCTLNLKAKLAGRFNLLNILAAVAIAEESSCDIEKSTALLKSFSGVPGRLERIDEKQGFEVFVDYAHTDDALRSTLEVLREITPGRIHLVFGCGGDRDRTKRPLMMHVAQTFGDYCWVTADNPRSEPLERIFQDMKRGVSKPDQVEFIEDRRMAISMAFDAAKPEDTVLIAGKGHEPFMEFADTIVPFDDRQVARELVRIKRHKPQG